MEGALQHYAMHDSIREAARVFGIPRSTLKDRIHGKVAIDTKMGHPTVLTAAEEANIVKTCCLLSLD